MGTNSLCRIASSQLSYFVGNRQYKPCLYLYNKIDCVTIEELDQLARMPQSMVGSVAQMFNIGEPLEDDLLKQNLWKYLRLTRIYTKRKGEFD
jgi:ribosome-interacting GTPase 1